MKYIWYSFLGLVSIGFLGALFAVACFFYVLNFYGNDLPDYSQLRNYKPPIVTRLYAGDGHLLAEFAQEKRIFVPIEFIPSRVKQAFIAVEDQNYYAHSGVDMKAVARAMMKYAKNKIAGVKRRPEGASTITQQVAKNFFFSNEVSLERKLKEAILAYRMNKALGKDHILELYLNQIFLGSGSYGVAAASLNYFGKALDQLTIAEAAYLAALPKAPNNYHLVKNYDAALTRRNFVISRMLAENYITTAQAEMAKIEILERKLDDSERIDAPYFAEEVRRKLSKSYGMESLYQGGLAVKTSVNPKLQAIAEKSLRDGLRAYDMRHGWRGSIDTLESMDDWRIQLDNIKQPENMLKEWDLAIVLEVSDNSAKIGFVNEDQGELKLNNTKWARKYLNEGYARGKKITSLRQVIEMGDVIMVQQKTDESNDKSNIYELRQIPQVQGALIALDPHTGRILAMQGGWKYKYGSSEFNRATQAMRQPGSAFKPFVYLAALDKGFTPATLVLDAPFILEDKIAGTWKPSNYSNIFYGPTPIRVGVEKSRNLMTVRLADFLGMELIARYSDHFGITDKMPQLLSNSLGSAETTLLRITAAYGMIANGGKKIIPSFIDRVQDRYGKTIFKHDDRKCVACGSMIKWDRQNVPDIQDDRERIADPRTTYQMTSIMEGVVQRGTGVRLRSLDRPIAGKTGTTNDSNDAWFIGFSPNLVVGVFVGFDNPRSLGRKETGSSVAIPIFKNFMQKALEGKSPAPFRKPQGIRNLRINAETGARAQVGDKKVIWESFIIGTEPTDEVYILDGDGISLMSGYYGSDAYNSDDYYMSPNADGYIIPSPQQQSRQNVPTSPVMIGTGGLY